MCPPSYLPRDGMTGIVVYCDVCGVSAALDDECHEYVATLPPASVDTPPPKSRAPSTESGHSSASPLPSPDLNPPPLAWLEISSI